MINKELHIIQAIGRSNRGPSSDVIFINLYKDFKKSMKTKLRKKKLDSLW